MTNIDHTTAPDQDPRCPFCGAAPRLLSRRHPGYVAGSHYSIFECQYCDMQFAWPGQVPAGIYESIYANAHALPGYRRYTEWHRSIKRQPEPLGWLAKQEAGFWFIEQEVARLAPSARIIEVGSGLGYLTYAIHAAGRDVVGIDVSRDAVAKSVAAFGAAYRHEDLADIARDDPEAYDLAIVTEVIEHVPDPVAFLRAVAKILKPGGSALVTTPNKSLSRLGAYWQTENPPIHLWWFSETAMRGLARLSGLSIEICDFSAMQGGARAASPASPELSAAPAWLDASGHVTAAARDWLEQQDRQLARVARYRRYLRWLWPSLRKARRHWQTYPLGLQRTGQIGAKFTKPAPAHPSDRRPSSAAS